MIKITTRTTGIEKIKEIPDNVDKALRAVANEFPNRSKGPVNKAIKAAYVGLKGTAKINAAKQPGKVNGYNATVPYKGGVLSLKEFSLRPASRPKRNRAYTIQTNIRGASSFGGAGSPYFIGPNGHAFKRTSDSSLPIERLSTLSVPAMMDNAAEPGIDSALNELLDSRYTHYLNYFLK